MVGQEFIFGRAGVIIRVVDLDVGGCHQIEIILIVSGKSREFKPGSCSYAQANRLGGSAGLAALELFQPYARKELAAVIGKKTTGSVVAFKVALGVVLIDAGFFE